METYRYKGFVRWYGDHYSHDSEVQGSKVLQTPDGKVFLYDDYERPTFPWTQRDFWVQVQFDRVYDNGELMVFPITPESEQGGASYSQEELTQMHDSLGE